MSIDFSRKIYLTYTQAAKRLPISPSPSTWNRWRSRGVAGVRLRTVKIGGRRLVEASELDRFIAAVTAAADGDPRPVRTARQRQRVIESAERELLREGVGRRGTITEPQE